jgi:hypothetical protein
MREMFRHRDLFRSRRGYAASILCDGTGRSSHDKRGPRRVLLLSLPTVRLSDLETPRIELLGIVEPGRRK